MIEPDHHEEELLFDAWDVDEEDDRPTRKPLWRRPLLVAVAALTVIALAIVPLYNIAAPRWQAENGLEVCGFDYCVVQDAVRDAGVNVTMSRLSNIFLDQDEARMLTNALTDYLGIEPVGLQVVERLEGRLGGVYDPVTRSISIESPARAWTVLHEVAHAVETDHGEEFRELLIDLATFVESSSD